VANLLLFVVVAAAVFVSPHHRVGMIQDGEAYLQPRSRLADDSPLHNAHHIDPDIRSSCHV